VTQDFEGAADLDIPGCANGGTVLIGKAWCAAGAPIEATPDIDRTGWDANTRVEFELLGPDGAPRAAVTVAQAGPDKAILRATADAEGFHTLRVTASNLPANNPEPAFNLSVHYTAPRDFTLGESVVVDTAKLGEWSKPFPLKNVAIHAHLLPTGKILYWGRRKEFGSFQFDTLNDHACQTYLLDPDTEESEETANQPVLKNGSTVNLFCSGHTFLPDGRLMVVGGHLFDSQGVNQS
jgi:hypothetical protein